MLQQPNPEEEQMLAEQLAKLQQSGVAIPTTIDPVAAFMLVCQLQLAYRHPYNLQLEQEGEGKHPGLVAFDLARQLQDRIREMSPELGAYLERGWHPEFDRPIDCS
ncbi:MAG: hypothetical protein AAGA60_29195 [Cyanobacteria bacterium P01_E01_bin.42]